MVRALYRYHRRHPPLHILFAHFAGYKPASELLETAAGAEPAFAQAQKLAPATLPPHLQAALERSITAVAPDEAPRHDRQENQI